MADLRIHNFGDTANGKVSGSIPNVHVNQVKWENINPAENLLDRLMAEKALELSKAKQDLDEQRFAYGAANDEAGRQHAIELEMLKNQKAKDNLDYEYSLKNNYANRLEAKQNLEDTRVEEVRRFISQIHDDIIRSGQNTPRVEVAKNLEDYLRNSSGFKNKYIDTAMALENLADNYKAIQSGGGKYNIGNRNIDFQ